MRKEQRPAVPPTTLTVTMADEHGGVHRSVLDIPAQAAAGYRFSSINHNFPSSFRNLETDDSLKTAVTKRIGETD
jgi:hypothetical protein